MLLSNANGNYHLPQQKKTLLRFLKSVGFFFIFIFLVNFSRISPLIYHQGVAGQAHAEELDMSSWNGEEGKENYESLITHFSNDRTMLEKYLHLCSR